MRIYVRISFYNRLILIIERRFIMNLNLLNKEREALIGRLKKRMEFLNLEPRKNLKTSIEKVNANLYYPLKEEEILQFQNANGYELATKAWKVNSSAALLLNIFTPLRRDGVINLRDFGKFETYELETKLQVLNGNGKKANIDMVLSNSKSYLYIESKFTELFYYQKKAPTSLSYQVESKYPSKEIYKAAIQFLDKYKVYDANQLVKHTIGIFRDCLTNPDKYKGKTVYLLNLSWELITSDKDLSESFKLQLEAIKEATEFNYKFNLAIGTVFKNIGINFKFVYMNYYDFYLGILNKRKPDYQFKNYITQRYFNIQRRGLNTDDAMAYLEAQLYEEISKEQFREILKGYNVIYLSEYHKNFSDDIELDKRFTKFLDALISIKNSSKKIPRINGEHNLTEFLHIHNGNYNNKTTVIYLSKVLPKAERVIFT